MTKVFRMLWECTVLAGVLVCAEPLAAQTVQQSGSVTPNHAAIWTTTGVIKDGGTAAAGNLSSLGVTASGPGICQRSANGGPYNLVCLRATATGGGIDMTNISGATGGFTFTLNGVTQGIATVTLPVTTNDFACFADTTGTLKDCSGSISGLTVTNHAVAIGTGVLGFNSAGPGALGRVFLGTGVTADPVFSGADFVFDNSVVGSSVLTLGINGTSTGVIDLANAGVGGAKIRIQNLSTVVAFNFNLPINAGTSGQALLSGGGAGSVMTFNTLGVAAGGTGQTSLNNNAILIGQGASGIGAIANLTDGQLVVGQTGAAPLQKTMSGDATFTAAGVLTIANNAVTLAKLATQAANTVLGNATAGTAVPTALAVGSCSSASSALIWTTNTGFGCNTSITAAAVPASGITGQVAVANGGTGIASGTSGGIPYFSSTTTIASSALLTANQIMIGGGAGAAPTTFACATSTTLVHGGTPPTCSQVSLTADVTGVLPIANGGTNNSATPTTNGIAAFDGTRFSTTTNFVWDVGGAKFCIGIAATTCTFAVSILGTVQYGLTAAGVGLRYQVTGSDFDLVGINYNNNTSNNISLSAAGGQTLRISSTGANAILTTASTSKTTGALTSGGGLGVAGATYTDTLNIITVANASTTRALCWDNTTGLVSENGTVGTCTVSDERLKNIEGRIDGALDKLLQINGFYYTWKDPSFGIGHQIGVGAQTVEKVFPELVQMDSTGRKSADYQRLVAPVIEALRELKADNDNLRQELKRIAR